MNKDRWIGLATFAFGAAALALSLRIPVQTMTEDPGPRLFPIFGSAMLLICGVGIFLQGKASGGKPFLTKEGWRRVGAMFVLLIAYGFALRYLGFLIASPIMLFVFIRMIARGKKVSVAYSVGYALIAVAAVWAIFEKGLNTMLPSGVLF